MRHLDLTKHIAKTPEYEAWKFPGGEIHFKFTSEFIEKLNSSKNSNEVISITCRLKTSDDIILLVIVLDTLAKDWKYKVMVFIPYMPYQQADRNFGEGECFSLRTIAKILNSYTNVTYVVFDPHSDITPALLNKCVVEDNSLFIRWVLQRLDDFNNNGYQGQWSANEDLVILSPDAGAYKKIFKLAEKIGFKGQIECANKFRNTTTGEINIRLSINDFKGKDILIIDDICVGGRTFIELAKQLVQCNISNLQLAVSHGIFSNGFNDLERYFQNIFTTNSIEEEYDGEDINVWTLI